MRPQVHYELTLRREYGLLEEGEFVHGGEVGFDEEFVFQGEMVGCGGDV